MDDIVLRAMAKWPDVPHAYGWLALDARGAWWLKGDRIANAAVTAFIGRNYASDDRGRWYFQNGPQRVFVSLAVTPYVFRVDPAGGVVAHTDRPVSAVYGAWLDDSGRIGLVTDLGPGIVDDRDLVALCARLQAADGGAFTEDALDAWVSGVAASENPRLDAHPSPVEVLRVAASTLPARFGFDPDPRPDPGEPEC